jgi:peroxiredoxin
VRARRHGIAALLIALLVPLLAACSDGLPAAPNSYPAAQATNTAAPPAPTVAATGGQVGNGTANLQIDPNANLSGNSPVSAREAAPDFSLPGVDGKTYSLSAQLGKVVVLEFIATWCPHCQNDAPMMNKLYDTYKSKNVQVFAINATPNGHDHSSPARMSDLQWFRDTYGVTFPLLFDAQLKSANDYGVYFYPYIYIVDQQGKVAFQPPDDQIPSYDLLAAQIDKIVSQGTQ